MQETAAASPFSHIPQAGKEAEEERDGGSSRGACGTVADETSGGRAPLMRLSSPKKPVAGQWEPFYSCCWCLGHVGHGTSGPGRRLEELLRCSGMHGVAGRGLRLLQGLMHL